MALAVIGLIWQILYPVFIAVFGRWRFPVRGMFFMIVTAAGAPAVLGLCFRVEFLHDLVVEIQNGIHVED